MLALGRAAVLLPDHVYGGHKPLVVLGELHRQMIAGNQLSGLDRIPVFEEFGAVQPLEIHNAVVVRFQNHLVLINAAQHAIDALQILRFVFGLLIPVRDWESDPAAARITTRILARRILARRILPGRILGGQRRLSHNQ